MGIVVYDCEIKKPVPPRDGVWLPGVEYCAGWEDYIGMGVACIGVIDIHGRDRQPRVFLQDNLDEFQRLVDGSCRVVGFNNHLFDDRLCAAHGIRIPPEKSVDLQEIIARAGRLADDEDAHNGLSLDKLCQANFGCGKSGGAAEAPVWWQAGQHGRVIDYCLRDVWLTFRLFDQMARHGWVRDPREMTRIITLRAGMMLACGCGVENQKETGE